MATKKRKKTTKKTSKTTSKKSLETKIAELEAKLASISSQTGGTAQQAPPPPPKPAEQAPPPKPAEQAPPPKPAEQVPKPAEQKAAPPATLAQALEDAWQNYPAGSSTHYYKEHTTGFTPVTNRYIGRLTAPIGQAPTTDWNLQKLKGTTPVPSNQYFATRARQTNTLQQELDWHIILQTEILPVMDWKLKEQQLKLNKHLHPLHHNQNHNHNKQLRVQVAVQRNLILKHTKQTIWRD